MNHQLLVAEFLATPWALMPERLNALAAVVMRWSAGIPAESENMIRIQADRVIRESRRQTAAVQSSGGIAVLPLYGVVTQRGNMVDDVSGPGSTSTQQFSTALRQLIADDTVGQILIDIDSPGGSVYGVAELADEIQSARAQKPVIAVANSLAASAAYWIGCSASEFYVTPGGEVGSIGVWQAHQDYSKALEEAGVKTTLISAGRFKVEPRMSVLSAGQLNHRIRIQQPTTVKDSLGAPTQVWTDVATVWADIQPLSGREARIADRVSAELTHQITVRHRPDLNDPQAVSRMRVLFRGRTFAIHAALNDDEANVSVILLASEGIRDG